MKLMARSGVVDVADLSLAVLTYAIQGGVTILVLIVESCNEIARFVEMGTRHTVDKYSIKG